MNRKKKLIEMVTLRLMNTAMRIDLESQRLPTPQEFATDVVEFLYGIKDDKIEESKT